MVKPIFKVIKGFVVYFNSGSVSPGKFFFTESLFGSCLVLENQ